MQIKYKYVTLVIMWMCSQIDPLYMAKYCGWIIGYSLQLKS